jgi:ferric-dicitrate binding protein FerR (iron transport regulator)
MEDQKIQELIEKFLSGIATNSEKEELNAWYKAKNNNDVIWEMETPGEEKAIEKRGAQNLKAYIKSTRQKHQTVHLRNFLAIAATITGICFVWGFYNFNLHNKKINNTIVKNINAPNISLENKYILLPDSSIIVLHPGSQVKYVFNAKTREVFLTGEAFFNVRHLANRPFIVHTRKITTTVLGTSFNIKAYPSQTVIVSVTRGKVGVTDEVKKTSVFLTPNQQIVISSDNMKVLQKAVQAQQTISWVSSDMQFTAVPFKELAEKLSIRYGVMVKFNDATLENYLITGRFTGTESLNEVLKALCGTSSSTYKINGSTVILDKLNN